MKSFKLGWLGAVSLALAFASSQGTFAGQNNSGGRVFLPSIASTENPVDAVLSEFRVRNATSLKVTDAAWKDSLLRSGRVTSIVVHLSQSMPSYLGETPGWLSKSDLGRTLSADNIPNGVDIPKVLEIPARELEIPQFNESGKLVGWARTQVPAYSLNFEKGLSQSSSSLSRTNAWKTATTVNVAVTTVQHCQNQNFATYTGLGGYQYSNSYLPTWTPTHGSVTNWNFAGAVPNVRLCMPTSLGWIYIAGTGGLIVINPAINWTIWSQYNNINNWWANW